MSTFTIVCPHCEQALEADDSLVDQILDCPACGKALVVNLPAVERSESSPILISDIPRRKKPHWVLLGGFSLLMVSFVVGIVVVTTGTSHRRTGLYDSQPEQESLVNTPPKPRIINSSELVPNDSWKKTDWNRKGTELRAVDNTASMDPFSFGPPTHHIRFEVKIDETPKQRLDESSIDLMQSDVRRRRGFPDASSAKVIVHGRANNYMKIDACVLFCGGFTEGNHSDNALISIGTFVDASNGKSRQRIPIRNLFSRPPKWITVDIEFLDQSIVFRFNKQKFSIDLPKYAKGSVIWKIEFANEGMNVAFRNVTYFPDANVSNAPKRRKSGV